MPYRLAMPLYMLPADVSAGSVCRQNPTRLPQLEGGRRPHKHLQHIKGLALPVGFEPTPSGGVVHPPFFRCSTAELWQQILMKYAAGAASRFGLLQLSCRRSESNRSVRGLVAPVSTACGVFSAAGLSCTGLSGVYHSPASTACGIKPPLCKGRWRPWRRRDCLPLFLFTSPLSPAPSARCGLRYACSSTSEPPRCVSAHTHFLWLP